LPPDERLAEPETRYEIIDGERVYVSPADEPHATEQVDLGYLLRAHLAPGYRAAVEMLTRTSRVSDYAPDASVFPAERDPQTGGRRLEELAFEVASTQSMAGVTRKGRGLAGRGVRRVFCLDIRRQGKWHVLEWSRETDDWIPLDPRGAIDDRCLVRPLPIAALLDAAVRDDEVARALIAKGNPVIEQLRAQERATERAESILRILEARGLEVTGELRERILGCTDLDRLARWLVRAATASSTAEITDGD
jgi:Uma2 family endonuclease